MTLTGFTSEDQSLFLCAKGAGWGVTRADCQSIHQGCQPRPRFVSWAS